MKRIFILLAFCGATCCAYSQKVTRDANGNYVAVSRSKDSTTGTPTGKTFTDTKGNIFPVLITKAGKLYVIRTSPKTGKQYKQYLKIDE